MKLDNLTEEQLTRMQDCDTPQELMDLVESEGIEIPDEALDNIAGGINPAAAIYQYVRRYVLKK